MASVTVYHSLAMLKGVLDGTLIAEYAFQSCLELQLQNILPCFSNQLLLQWVLDPSEPHPRSLPVLLSPSLSFYLPPSHPPFSFLDFGVVHFRYERETKRWGGFRSGERQKELETTKTSS